jgi:hypothetical protein
MGNDRALDAKWNRLKWTSVRSKKYGHSTHKPASKAQGQTSIVRSAQAGAWRRERLMIGTTRAASPDQPR